MLYGHQIVFVLPAIKVKVLTYILMNIEVSSSLS